MKRLARSIPGANSRTIALRALAIPSVKLALVHNVGRLVRREIKTLCADKFASIQRDTSSLIHGMSLEPIFSELSKNAPILTALLMESCPSIHKKRCSKKNSNHNFICHTSQVSQSKNEVGCINVLYGAAGRTYWTTGEYAWCMHACTYVHVPHYIHMQ